MRRSEFPFRFCLCYLAVRVGWLKKPRVVSDRRECHAVLVPVFLSSLQAVPDSHQQ